MNNNKVVFLPNKKKSAVKFLLWACILLFSFACKITTGQIAIAKKVFITSKEYNKLKIENKLNPAATYFIDLKKEAAAVNPKINPNRPNFAYRTSGGGICDTLVGCDSSFTLVPGINFPNDDNPGSQLMLPFTICFYGTNYNSVYVNNNGNFTFVIGYGVFTPTGFPTNAAIMIAPFWADVDTRVPASGPVSNLPCMEITNTHITVIWDHVDYYSTQTGGHIFLFNTFRCTVTDGNDPILPAGSNVGFFYGDMNWTTGDASGGLNGFGGFAATVGANAGNNIDFIQFGRFDAPGTAYDGPFGNNDGVDFLDNRTFVFNTCGGANFNLPPIFSGNSICDTLQVCVGDSAHLNYNFLPGEANQIAIPSFNSNGLNNFTITNLDTGANAVLNLLFIPDTSNLGLNTITVSATDNGTVPATSTFNIIINVNSLPTPVITGDHFYCAQNSPGVTLHVQNGYDAYLWSTGATGVDSLLVTAGTYNVEVTDPNGCKGKAPAFPVWESVPIPIIGGITAVCGQDAAHLTTTRPFVSFHWSNNSTNDTIVVGTGVYTVDVIDSLGCTATSPPLTVALHSYPDALFSYSPLNVIAGDSIRFTDLSTPGSGSIASWHWDFGDGATSNLKNPSHVFTASGSHPVSLTVTQADGCSKTYLFTIEPTEVIASNILTPNGDGKNDVFYFKHLEFYPNSKLEVFNRWGKKVYESGNYQNDWKGGDLVDGVYYYILKIPEKDAMKGTLTIRK